jgi:protein-S-isoprenylcysteine O-methyltransferase Ste14
MLAGTVLLLPTPLSLMVFAIHLLCILAKAADEEDYLRQVHGEEYGSYRLRTGRFFPKLRSRSK